MDGKITITIPEGGAPQVEILGRIRPQVLQMLPNVIRKAYRSHVAAINRSLREEDKQQGVSMEDKGPTLAETMTGETHVEPAPVPYVKLDMPATPDELEAKQADNTLITQDEEANNTNESEAQDGEDEQAGTDGDAEGPGSTGGSEESER